MLRQVAEGVLIHESEFCQSNAVVVHGRAGVLLIDPGVHGDEMACLANDLSDLGQTVVAGFSTHPALGSPALARRARRGAPLRHGPLRGHCPRSAVGRGCEGPRRRAVPPDIAEQVPLDLLGLITGLPAETAQIPWDGPQVRIIEHQAHAPGHAALLIEERGVLVAGDMLSDVLIPMLDLNGTADPIEDYLAALRLLEGVAGDVDVLVPATGPSAELIRYTHGSTRIARTCGDARGERSVHGLVVVAHGDELLDPPGPGLRTLRVLHAIQDRVTVDAAECREERGRPPDPHRARRPDRPGRSRTSARRTPHPTGRRPGPVRLRAARPVASHRRRSAPRPCRD